MGEIRILGIGVSEGIRFGTVFIYKAPGNNPAAYAERIEAHRLETELERLGLAKTKSLDELDRIIASSEKLIGEDKSAILHGQKSFLNDPAFYGEIQNQIRKTLVSPEQAVQDVERQLTAVFAQLNHAYIKERIHDIRDVAERLLMHLQQKEYPDLSRIDQPVILVAEDLSPSVTVQLDKTMIQGFVTRYGGETTHTAILSRSLGIPAVVGTGEAFSSLRQGDFIILDGKEGLCILNPQPATLEQYKVRLAEELSFKRELSAYKLRPGQTADGVHVELAVNIGMLEEISADMVAESHGVGLFRTEFLFMHADHFPTEDEQFRVYKQVLEQWGGKPVIIRTLDIGGDKQLSYWNLPEESNSFLGMRAIRLSLGNLEIFRTQLRAILRASAFGCAKIMFPMVSSMQELREAKALTERIKQELRESGSRFDESLEIGIMAEVPAVIQLADRFAKEVDFFSIGTNDLVQYTLAVDRMNEKVAPLYDYFHPAVLRSIHSLIKAAHLEGKRVGMCGSMAGDPLAAPLLLAMGLDEWSMDIGSVAKQKHTLASITMAECRNVLEQTRNADTAEEVRTCLNSFYQSKHTCQSTGV